MLLLMAIPDLLDRELKKRKLSERALAGYLGVSANAVNAWHKGLRTPDPAYCQKLADYFGLPLEMILMEAGHTRRGEDAPPVAIDPQLGRLVKGPKAKNKMDGAIALAMAVWSMTKEAEAEPPVDVESMLYV